MDRRVDPAATARVTAQSKTTAFSGQPSEATFYYWKRKLAGSLQESAESQGVDKAPRARSFLPVLVRPSQSQSVLILLSDGTKIELQCDAISALHAVLQDAKRAS